MLSPLDLQNKKVVTKKKKYDKAEIDDYIDLLFENTDSSSGIILND